MAAFVQKNEMSDGTASSSVTLQLGVVTAGNLVIAVVNWGNASGAGSGNVTSITDDPTGDVWHKLGPTKYTGVQGGEVWYKIASTTVNAGVIFHLSTSFTFHRAASCEYSGVISPYIDTNASNPVTNTGSGSSLTSGTLTTSSTNVLVELAFTDGGNTMPSSGSFTQRVAGSNGSQIQDDLSSHAPGTYSFSGTLSGTPNWASFLVGLIVLSSTRYTYAKDNFNRADANPIGGNWTPLSNTGGYVPAQIVSNAVESSATNNADSWYNALVAWPNDQWAQITVKSLNNSYIGVSLRQSTSNALTAYRFFYGQGSTGGSAALIIQKEVAGTYTQIGTSGAATINVNDVLLAEVIGTTLNFYVNGVLRVTAIDSSIVSGAAGFLVSPVGAVGNAVLDDWQGGGFIPFIQATWKGYAYASHGTTFTSNSMTLTAGHLAVVVVNFGAFPFGSVTSVVDGQGNIYTNLVSGNAVHSANSSFFGGYGNFSDIWYCENCLGGTGIVTVTVTFSGNDDGSVGWLEYATSGTGLAIGYIGGQIGTQGSAGTISVNTVATGSGSSNIIVASLKNDNNNGTAWSYIDRINGVDLNYNEIGDQVSVAAGGEVVTSTVSGAAKWFAVAIVFKLVGSVIVVGVPNSSLLMGCGR